LPHRHLSRPFLFACGLAVLAALPLFSNPGFLITRGVGDTPNLLFRVQQLLAALSAGDFPARWMPDADFGYGYPYFNYYASFSTYLAVAFKAYGFSFVNAIKLTQLVALLVAAAGMYAWARSLAWSRPQALLASAAYTFAPFHLVNLYVRGDSLAELWAMAFYPVTLWLAQRLVAQPAPQRALHLAFAIAALIFTHNISALNFLPFLLLYLLLNTKFSKPLILPSALFSLLALLLSLLLSAFFWLPALFERDFIQLSTLTNGFFFYGQHFRSLDLIQPTLFFNFDPDPSAGATPFSMGLVQALLASAGVIVLLYQSARTRSLSPSALYLLLGFALSTVMITPLSAWLWGHLPLISYTQFPWRFLSIQALFTAALTAYLISNSPILKSSLLSLLLSLLSLFPVLLLPFRLEFIPLTDADVTAERLNLYEYFSGDVGNTVSNEYLPRWVNPRPFTSGVLLGRAPRPKVLRGEATGTRLQKNGASEQWHIQATTDQTTLAVPTHYWPGWVAEVDGQRVNVYPTEGLGWITLDLGRGEHTVALKLEQTPLRTVAEGISLITLVVSIALIAVGHVTARRALAPKQSPHQSQDYFITAWLSIGVFVVLVSIVLRLWPDSLNTTAPLSMDRLRLAYPHHAPIRFAGGEELQRVTYSAEHLARGTPLVIHTEWNAAAAGQVTLSLVTPPALDQTLILASDTRWSADQNDFTLRLPSDLSPGVYFITVEHASDPALTASGEVRGLIYLAPVWVDDEQPITPPPGVSADFGATLRVESFTAMQNGATLQIRLFWKALAELPSNLQLSLRVRDVTGNEWAARDAQLTGGLYPTELWRSGEVVPDRYDLPLLNGLPPGQYDVSLMVYDAARDQNLGETTLRVALTATTPLAAQGAWSEIVPGLALQNVSLPTAAQIGSAPEFPIQWAVTQTPAEDYALRWDFITPDGEVTPIVSELAPGSPTSTWPAHTAIVGRARFAIPPTFKPGVYQVRFTVLDAHGQPLSAPRILGDINITGEPRLFSVPPLSTPINATFGAELKLWGYDLKQSDRTLELTLAWGAPLTPTRDYKFFVHLFDPATEAIIAQADKMPHDFAYPTGQWLQNEVVTDTVVFTLAEVAPGAYQVAVGWYDPAQPDLARLAAFDAQGQPLVADRVVLPTTVTVP